jgi:hypothetical protein
VVCEKGEMESKIALDTVGLLCGLALASLACGLETKKSRLLVSPNRKKRTKRAVSSWAYCSETSLAVPSCLAGLWAHASRRSSSTDSSENRRLFAIHLQNIPRCLEGNGLCHSEESLHISMLHSHRFVCSTVTISPDKRVRLKHEHTQYKKTCIAWVLTPQRPSRLRP